MLIVPNIKTNKSGFFFMFLTPLNFWLVIISGKVAIFTGQGNTCLVSTYKASNPALFSPQNAFICFCVV